MEAPRHVRGAYAMGFAFTSGTTFYTRHGDWFAWICVMVSVGVVGLSLRVKSSGSNLEPWEQQGISNSAHTCFTD